MPHPRDDGRLLTVNETDHSPWLWIVNIVGLVLILSSAVYRLLQRWNTWNLTSYDDHLAAGSFILSLVYFAILLAAASLGLGHEVTAENQASISQAAKYAFASRILCAAIICASQCSVLLTLGRIVHVRRDSWKCFLAVGSSAVCFLATLLTYTIDCDPSSVISGVQNNACSGPESRLIVVSTLSALNEVSPLALAVYFFFQLQMASEQRWYAISGYICRISNIILIAVSAVFAVRFTRTGQTSIDIVTSLVVQDLLVVSEFLSVVAIYLARAMKDFQTAGPAITLSSAKDFSGKGGSKWTFGASKTGASKVEDSKTSDISMKLRSLRSGDSPGVRNHISHVDREDRDGDAGSENSQQGIMKSVQYEVTVDGQSLRQPRSETSVLDIEPDEGSPPVSGERRMYGRSDDEHHHGNFSRPRVAHV